jgi:hypothetical protein
VAWPTRQLARGTERNWSDFGCWSAVPFAAGVDPTRDKKSTARISAVFIAQLLRNGCLDCAGWPRNGTVDGVLETSNCHASDISALIVLAFELDELDFRSVFCDRTSPRPSQSAMTSITCKRDGYCGRSGVRIPSPNRHNSACEHHGKMVPAAS